MSYNSGPPKAAYALAGFGTALQGGNPLMGYQALQAQTEKQQRKEAIGKLMAEMGIAGAKRSFLNSLPIDAQQKYILQQMQDAQARQALQQYYAPQQVQTQTTDKPYVSNGELDAPYPGMNPYADAIAKVESGGNYQAVGPVTKSGDRAYGKYQVMGSNIGPWSREVLGREVTPQEFMANPQIQDAIFKAKFGEYVNKYGNPQDAASMWFSGRPMAKAGNASDGYNTVPQYVQKFNAGLPDERRRIETMLQDPRISPEVKKLELAKYQAQIRASDPLAAAKAEKLSIEAEQMQRGARVLTDREKLDLGLDVTGAYVQKPDGTIDVVNAPAKDPTSVSEYLYYQNQAIANGEKPMSYGEWDMARRKSTGTTINVGTKSKYGTAPQGYVWAMDKNGEVKLQQDPETGAYVPVAVPIPGGPKDTTKQDVIQKGQREQAGLSVLSSISDIRNTAEKSFLPVTGVWSYLSALRGSAQRDVEASLNTIKANIGFDRLQQMRDSSPTGGALGQVSTIEMELLQSAVASLDSSQSREQFFNNLKKVEKIYLDIVHGPGNWTRKGNQILVREPGGKEVPWTPNATGDSQGMTVEEALKLGGQ